MSPDAMDAWNEEVKRAVRTIVYFQWLEARRDADFQRFMSRCVSPDIERSPE